MLGSIGGMEIMIIMVVLLILFGPRQLPKMGRAFGDTIREFRKVGKAIEENVDDDPR